MTQVEKREMPVTQPINGGPKVMPEQMFEQLVNEVEIQVLSDTATYQSRTKLMNRLEDVFTDFTLTAAQSRRIDPLFSDLLRLTS